MDYYQAVTWHESVNSLIKEIEDFFHVESSEIQEGINHWGVEFRLNYFVIELRPREQLGLDGLTKCLINDVSSVRNGDEIKLFLGLLSKNFRNLRCYFQDSVHGRVFFIDDMKSFFLRIY